MSALQIKNTSESESLGFICFLVAARLTCQSPDSFCHSTSHLLVLKMDSVQLNRVTHTL